MRHIRLAAAALLAASAASASADTIANLGTDTAIALPIIAGGITLYKQDWTGSAELVVDTVGTVGIAYGLKHIIKERRPDGSDFQSMPSDTSALAFAPAQFLWDRYGWEYGVPAYAAAGFVAYSRVEAKKHHWYDTVASAGIAFGVSKLFTTRYTGPWKWDAGVGDGGGYAQVRYDFN
jgi:membrane-associated phospholipid phosphatase